jgi:hypothetical protein
VRAFISLGAGVQSTTVAPMAAEGLISPMPEAAIFADTRGSSGAGGMIGRHRTRDYKVLPIRKKVRELLDMTGRRMPADPIAESRIGISTDEAHRMKPADARRIVNRWPLIEAGMSRAPKSSCTFCPFRSDRQRRSLTREEFEDACALDDRLRDLWSARRDRVKLYLRRSRRPLREVDLAVPEPLIDVFGNE